MQSLQQYASAVPAFERMITTIRTLLAHDRTDLEFVYQAVRTHLQDNNFAEPSASELAEMILGDLCLDLPSDDITFSALRTYVTCHDCFHAYDRLLTEFGSRLGKEEYKSLVEHGTRVFSNEVLTWDPSTDR